MNGPFRVAAINRRVPEGLSYPATRGDEVVGRVLDRTPYSETGTTAPDVYVFEAQTGQGPPWTPGPTFPRFDQAEAALARLIPAPPKAETPAKPAPKKKPTYRSKSRIPMKE